VTNGSIVMCDGRGVRVVYAGWKLRVIRLLIQFIVPPHFTRYTCFLATQFATLVYPMIHSHQPAAISIGYRIVKSNLDNNIIILID
jgi:hypothetical protein